jgi:WD40 repeat protein
LNPVTALEFHHSRTGALLVFAGEGSLLKIFDAGESRLLCQCEVFQGQAIHGIAVRDHVDHEFGLQLVIWGGSSLALLTKHKFDLIWDQNVSSILDTAISVSDWILDVAISPFDDVGCVLVTAHNTVIRARLGNSNHAPLLETLDSPSRSILYSAHLTWESPSCVMVAAGTVFGEIIVWQCSPSDERVTLGSHVLFTFTGHEGSIFGVNISPPIVGLDDVTRLLASCSDDRTIRVWNLNVDSNGNRPTATAVLARETGFGENICTESTNSKNSYMAMAMGHASRIWRVRFLGDQFSPLEPSTIGILSFGEDSTTQQWALVVETNTHVPGLRPHLSAKLSQLNTFAFHSGKHIWSTALRRMDDSKAILATGGADGKISLYEFRTSSYLTAVKSPRLNDAKHLSLDMRTVSNEQTWSSSWELDEILKSSRLKSLVKNVVLEQPSSKPSYEVSLETINSNPTKKTKAKKAPKDVFNQYTFISENEILITTTFGRVLLCRIDPFMQWEEISLPESGLEDLKSYAVAVGFPEICLACLAGANGSIYVYHRHHGLLNLARVEGKVADMFRICDPQTKCFELLVTTLGGMMATLFSFNLSGRGVRLVETNVYNLPEKFIVTSAGRNNSMLVLGSRAGSLALYSTLKPETPLEIWTPPSDIPRDAITTITNLPISDEPRGRGSEYFLTTGRDGFYSIFSTTILRDSNMAITSVVVYQVHQGTPPFGPLIEEGWFEGKDLILYGFKGKNFVVWNESKQCEITNVECGGSHRSYAYSATRGLTGGYFVFTKASKMYLHSHQNLSHKIIKSGGHGREIKACAVSKDQGLIATGAEDTAIRIWQYNNKILDLENPLNCQTIIHKHSAGIQHLRWHESKYLFSSGGNEEFFIWAVEQIPGFGIGVTCEATCPDPHADRDLRVMSFDVTELSNPSDCRSTAGLLISLAYSDSTIRTYTYSKGDSFHLLATGRYTSSCLTQIRHVRVQGDEIAILTAATDGKLTLWKRSRHADSRSFVRETVQLDVLSTQRIHQSAIKSLDIMRFKNHILVAAGGDDNALSISFYPISNPIATVMATCFIFRSAHAAAITSLCFVPDHEAERGEDSIKIVSSGNDQKVKAWVVRMDKDGEKHISLKIRKVGDTVTPVADVGDVVALAVDSNPGKILIVGNGMEIWKIFGQKGKGIGV